MSVDISLPLRVTADSSLAPMTWRSISFGQPISIDMTAVIGMMNVSSYLTIGSVGQGKHGGQSVPASHSPLPNP